MNSVVQKYNWFIEKANIDRKDYQLDGIEWCVKMETHRDPALPIRGGFIADEMGLGKTIMMIATFIAHLVPRTLIVLPNVLIEQWQSEIFRTTGHRALIYHGSAKKYINLEKLNSAKIVITTYATVALSKKVVDSGELSLLHQVEWDRVVFDEGHHLRNKNARWTGCKMLKSRIRWLISGTPIQNKRKDFFNLCSILKMPSSYFANSNNLRHLVMHFVLKRTKKLVGISLPELILDKQFVSWNNEGEKQLSRDIHRALTVSKVKLKMIIHARQSCILPCLLKGAVDKMVQKKLIQPFHPDTILSTTKLDAVTSTILSRRHNGNGKLVFCHFKGEMDLIVSKLREGGIDNIAIFDGRVSQAARAKLLKQPFHVIVMQIQTGCEGLNLQNGFSEIYFVSPHWNPSVEDQAIARCHRIGQTKIVSVFRFQMDTFTETDTSPPTLTLDQYINVVQDGKRVISNQLFEDLS